MYTTNKLFDCLLMLLRECQIKEPEPESETGDQVEYDCDLLNDDELFIKLQSDDIQSLFGELEEEIKATSPAPEVSCHAQPCRQDDTNFASPVG